MTEPRLERGQIWRTKGRYGWIRIEHVMLPGRPEYDGGLPGISYETRDPTGRWGGGWFAPASGEKDALRIVRQANYRRFLATDLAREGE